MRTALIYALILGLTGAVANFVYAADEPPGLASAIKAPNNSRSEKPNIVVILADDLGYGDVQRFNPAGKIPTPNIDELADAGMMFTDAHSPSAVCSPTRYGIITGRYAWRSQLKSGVLGGLSPRLIEPDRSRSRRCSKTDGYHTACIGKWHLGMDWQLKPGKKVTELSIEPREQVFNVDYDKPITNGPNAVGFDYYFGITASLDMVPYTFIENDHVVANPTEDRDFPLMLGNEKGGRCRKGPAAPGFEVEDVLPALAKKAVNYIGERAKAKTAVLPLPAAELAAHADRAHRAMAEEKRLQHALHGLRDADRRGRRRSARSAQEARTGREHARHLHQRQRLFAASGLPHAD